MEDNQKWISIIQESVKGFFQNDVRVDTYFNAEAFLDAGTEYQIVYMDVELQGMDGFEALQRYKTIFPDSLAVIVTAHEELCQKGYKVRAFRYLYKRNFEQESLEMLQSAMLVLHKYEKIRFRIVGQPELKISCKDVIFFETYGRNVQIHTTKGCYVSSEKITNLEERMEKEGFYRAHKSYLVNFEWVQHMGVKEIVLRNGEKIPISAKKKEDMWFKMNNWRFDRDNG